uniref:C-C motif chemokine 36.1 n=1 Tax=Scatophagus argus TaxID=75038 RepID=UPI001ED80D6C|nr:C-C motif chemokine 36.1 [Scatophagus argus]
MRTSHIVLLCILGAALLSSVICKNEIGPDDCCFTFYPRRLRKTLIRSYYMTDFRCPKTGVILVSQKSRHICADPNLSWVGSIIQSLDENSICQQMVLQESIKMRTSHIVLLCILGAALLSSVICKNGLNHNDCCFTFYPRRLRKTLIRSYYMTDFRCPKTAVILVTQKSRHICADPNLSWVASIIQSLDENSFEPAAPPSVLNVTNAFNMEIC